MILDGKRILVTGVISRESIAFAVAEQAQNAGAAKAEVTASDLMRLVGGCTMMPGVTDGIGLQLVFGCLYGG